MTVMYPEQPQDIPKQSGSGRSPSADDPAASLRAAALLTLKSKRRRLVPAPEVSTELQHRSLAIQPPIELDYGQEESLGASSTTSSTPAVSGAPGPAPRQEEPQRLDVDEGQGREEGEISDSEQTPETPAAPAPKPTAAIAQSSSADKAKVPIPRKPPPINTVAPVAPTVSGPRSGNTLSATPSQVSPGRSTFSFVLDANHVRPGLSMNQEQYDTAKDIVLDLLGWGVPPEYLVSCGLSRELVYYVFVELNLRLPANLDTTGIPPYEPPPLEPSPQLGNMTQRFDSMALQSRLNTPMFSSASGSILPHSAAPASIYSQTSAPSLADMEQQRRQELLARKAVLASRKLKQQASASSSATSVVTDHAPDQDVDMDNADIPTKTVEDFLKSIEAAPEKEHKPSASSIHASQIMTSVSMNVDEQIPGLSVSDEPISASRSSLPPSARSGSSSDLTSFSSVTRPPSTGSVPPAGFVRSPSQIASPNDDSPVNGSDVDVDMVPGLLSDQTKASDTTMFTLPPRRGTKRPVAADFVDLEPGSSHGSSIIGYQNYNSPYYQSSVRRKLSAFAGLSGMRRCVINLSDSEDDDDEAYDYNDGQRGKSKTSHSLAQRQVKVSRASPTSALRPPPNGVASSRKLSPGTPQSDALSPAALREKEEEIKRMREMIAQREQNRLRKLAAVSRNTPPVPSDNAAPVVVKLEEDDSMASATLSKSGILISDHAADKPIPDDSKDGKPTSTSTPPGSTPTPLSISLPESVSTSSDATPIDIISNAFEHHSTGDKVLTNEARDEQVVNGTQSEASRERYEEAAVGVIGTTAETSAQIEISRPNVQRQERAHEDRPYTFSDYSSPLQRFPLLRSYSRQPYSGGGRSSSSGDGRTYAITQTSSRLDLHELKRAHVKYLLTDHTKRICQYEVPGGGECRDHECEDIHLSRISSLEPGDEETAQYLYAQSGFNSSVKDIKDTLEDIRQRDPSGSYDDRVLQALVKLGLR